MQCKINVFSYLQKKIYNFSDHPVSPCLVCSSCIVLSMASPLPASILMVLANNLDEKISMVGNLD